MWDILRSVWLRHVTTSTHCTKIEKEKDFFMYIGDAAGQWYCYWVWEGEHINISFLLYHYTCYYFVHFIIEIFIVILSIRIDLLINDNYSHLFLRSSKRRIAQKRFCWFRFKAFIKCLYSVPDPRKILFEI